jgi:uncharacterized membrane protein YeaQ/YmgE (transglycosylase-associated protein family)
MDILVKIIIGFIVGLVARFIKPGNDKMGIIFTTLLGIAGAFVGSYLGQVFGIYAEGEPAGFIGAVLGAIILLIILKILSPRR